MDILNNTRIYSDTLNDDNRILGIVLPVVKSTQDDIHGKFLRTLHNLKDLVPVSTMLVNFQRFSQAEIDEIVGKMHAVGFKVKYTINSYNIKPHVPYNQILSDTARLMTDAALYLCVDDDMTFGGATDKLNKSAGRQFLECIYHMLTHPSCGIISCRGAIQKNPPKNYIGPHPKSTESYIPIILCTGSGMIARNVGTPMTPNALSDMVRNAIPDSVKNNLPSDYIEALGCLDFYSDLATAAMSLLHGYYIAIQPYTHVSHRITHSSNNDARQALVDKGFSQELIDLHTWSDDTKWSAFGYLYNLVIHNPVPFEVYRQASQSSGIDFIDYTHPDVIKSETSYYPEDVDTDTIMSQIKHLYNSGNNC